MSGARRAAAIPFAVFLLIEGAAPAFAAPYLPALGGAAGADSGDSASKFTGLSVAPHADLFSGAVTTRIAIEVPPGRLAATPRLALQYSSHAGASPYGHGWSLPIPRISRSTRHGVPRYDDSDTFVLAIDETTADLEAIAGTPRYRSKKESTFLRIGFDRAANRWRVVDKSGTTFIFGNTMDARLGLDATAATTTGAWLLSRTIDPFGNDVDYEYLLAPDAAATGLPVAIRYGGNLDARLDHIFEVRFSWAPKTYPKAPVSNYRGGFRSDLSRILLAIETLSPRGLVRRYNMNHEIDPAAGHARLAAVSLDGFSLDGGNDVALPSTVFVYSPATPHDWPLGSKSSRRAQATVFPSPGGFRDSGSNVDFDTFDIDGDAIADYVNAASNPSTVRRGGPGGFSTPTPWSWPASAKRVRKIDSGNDIVINVFDLTGDGLPDLVDARENACGTDTWCVYLNTGNGFALTPSFWPARGNRLRATTIDGTKVRVDLIDMNGDGLPDLVDASAYTNDDPHWNVYRNNGNGFALVPQRVFAIADSLTRSEIDGDRSFILHGLFDMNGDGLPDFVRADVDGLGSPLPLSRPHWNVHLHDGSGFEAAPTAWKVEGSSAFRLSNFVSATLSDPDRSDVETYDELVDMNADGRPDIVRHYNGADFLAFGLEPLPCSSNACSPSGTMTPPVCCFHVLVFWNTGASFSAPSPWAAWHDYKLRSYSRSPSPAKREFDLFDYDGDGLIDLIEIEDGEWRLFRHPASPASLGNQVPQGLRYRPNLLVAMMNGIGGQTYLSYSPVAGSANNRLPFPLWTMASQRTYDGVSTEPSSTTSNQYRFVRYDAKSAEFRGFGLVWQQDGAGRVTATEFHQDDLRTGLAERSLSLGVPSCAATDPLDSTDPCSPWHNPLELRENEWPDTSPLLLRSHTVTPFHGGAPVGELGKRLEYTYDTYGNVTEERVSSPSAATAVTTTTYARSVRDAADGLPSRYLVDRPLVTMTRDAAALSVPLAERRFVYDQDEPVTGALLQSRTCIEWSGGNCARWRDQEFRYDRVGNVTSVRGPTGGVTSLRYDALRLYAEKITNPAREETTILRDTGTGREIHTELATGQTRSTEYDGLSRPLRHLRRTGAETRVTSEIAYYEGAPSSSPSWVRTTAVGAGPSVVFHDGLGRILARKAWVDTSEGVRTIVSGLRRYGRTGEVEAEAAPFAATSSVLTTYDIDASTATAWTTHVRDSDGRLIESRFPDGSRIRRDDSVPGVSVTIDPNLAGDTFPGTARIEFRDGLGRVWRRDECATTPSRSSANQCPLPALVARTEYDHDALDRVVRTTIGPHLAASSTTRNDYDGAGNRIRYSSDDLGQWTYVYDDGGALVGATDPRGARVQNFFDRAGRLRRQVTSDSRATYKFHRRGPGTGSLRRVTSKTSSARLSKTFSYDAWGRLVEDAWRMRLAGMARSFAVRHGYDDADRRVSTTYPSTAPGRMDTLRTEYTPFGLPFALRLESSAGNREIVRAAAYDLFGNLTRIDYGNDLSDRWSYVDPATSPRVACTRTASSYAAGTACDIDAADLRGLRVMARDHSGHVLDSIDLRNSGTPADASTSYAYDPLGRLTTARSAMGSVEHFAYDALGNLSVDTRSGSFVYLPGSPHVARSAGDVPLTHDAAGNRTGKGSWSYEYDALGRLTAASLAGRAKTRYHYDEAGTRIASQNLVTHETTIHVGGLFDLRGHHLTRYFHLGGRMVAIDFLDGDAGSMALPTPDASRTNRAPREMAGLGELGMLTMIGLCAPLRRRRVRRIVAMLTTASFVSAATLAHASIGVNRRVDRPHHVETTEMLFVHADLVGSPQILTDASGTLVEARRYTSYGSESATYGPGGSTSAASRVDLGFNGHPDDELSELIYFGSRFYDPDLGLFLTPDPQAEHASPYLFGGGNPLYASDPDGEALFGLLFAILQPVLASAMASAVVSSIAAAAGGGDVAGAFMDGFVAGGSGAIIGTAIGAANIGLQFALGGSQYIELADAMTAAVDVAKRSAFTTTVSHAAATAARTSGANSDWTTVVSLGAALGGSYTYDQFIVGDSGATASQRTMARDGVRSVNTKVGHSNVTREAAVGTGWGAEAHKLVAANVERDGGASILGKLRTMLFNQEHFGRLPASITRIQGEIDGVIAGAGSGLLGAVPGAASGAADSYLRAVGAATHYVQDHLTLGHMLPGTALFAGPIGAPIRFVIHQVFGGEIAFRSAQIRATRSLLTAYGPAV